MWQQRQLCASRRVGSPQLLWCWAGDPCLEKSQFQNNFPQLSLDWKDEALSPAADHGPCKWELIIITSEVFSFKGCLMTFKGLYKRKLQTSGPSLCKGRASCIVRATTGASWGYLDIRKWAHPQARYPRVTLTPLFPLYPSPALPSAPPHPSASWVTSICSHPHYGHEGQATSGLPTLPALVLEPRSPLPPWGWRDGILSVTCFQPFSAS